jgi:hypothetical protein
MLSSNLVASEVLNHLLGHITECNHAHGLPHTQTDTRHHAAVQAFDTGLPVDVFEGVADGHLLGPVGVFFLALHFYAHDFDGLVPGGETTTKSGGEDLFGRTELDGGVFLVGDFADAGFAVGVVLVGLFLILLSSLGGNLRNTAETEPRTPVGDLSNSNSVDTLVDARNTFAAVDVHESSHSTGSLSTRLDGLVLGHLDGLHACAEAHGRIGLRQTTSHATNDAGAEVVGAEAAGVVLGLGSDEEENGAFGRGFDPGPGNETLVDCAGGVLSASYTLSLTLLLGGVQLTAKDTTTAPNPSNGTGHAVLPVGSHGGLQDLQRLPKSSDLEQVQTSAEQQVAELDGLLLERSWGGDGRHVELGVSNGYVAGPRQEGGFVACWGGRWGYMGAAVEVVDVGMRARDS